MINLENKKFKGDTYMKTVDDILNYYKQNANTKSEAEHEEPKYNIEKSDEIECTTEMRYHCRSKV